MRWRRLTLFQYCYWQLTIIIIIIIIIIMPIFMALSSWKSHCESSLGSFDECRLSAKWAPTLRPSQPTGAVSSPVWCYRLHPPSPFITIPQPEVYSFYRPTDGRRLSRPSWLASYRDGLPSRRRSPIQVLTGPTAQQLRWSRPTRYC